MIQDIHDYEDPTLSRKTSENNSKEYLKSWLLTSALRLGVNTTQFTQFTFVKVDSSMLYHLKVKMKSMSNMQKVATLSIVFIKTTSCLRRAGRKRTSLSTRKRRKVLSTERPPSACPIISHTLVRTHIHSH